MSSLSEMWSNPITRNQRRPPAIAPARSRSVSRVIGFGAGEKSPSGHGGGGKAPSFQSTPPIEHRRRHSAMPSRSSGSLIGQGGSNDGGLYSSFHGVGGGYVASSPSEYAALRGELPPPTLPILQSSSGSEDEGFGPDDESLLQRLKLLAASPIVSRALNKQHVSAPATTHPSYAPPSPPTVPAPKPPAAASRNTRASPPPLPPPPISLSTLLSTRSEPRETWGDRQSEGTGGRVRRQYFCNSRLEDTLALIRSGQAFCNENHITVDFVKRATVTGRGTKAQARAVESDLLRHALLITDAALYMLEVRMLPRSKPAVEPGPRRGGDTGHDDKAYTPDPGSGGPPALAAAANPSGVSTEAAVGPGLRNMERSRNGRVVGREWRGAGDRAGGGSGGTASQEKKIRSIQMMSRLLPSQLSRVSLPFREIPLRNGDVVARRGCSIVLHTRVGGKVNHLWLKCRSNLDRGALVEALVRWYEASSPDGAELNVQQELVTALGGVGAQEKTDNDYYSRQYSMDRSALTTNALSQ